MYITQDIANRIKQLGKERHISMKELLSACNMNINAISEFSKGKQLSCVSLARIADYLNCSVDYLLGRTDVPDGVVSFPDQLSDPVLSDLTDSYSALNQEGREKLTDYADDLVTSGKYKKIDPAELGQKEG